MRILTTTIVLCVATALSAQTNYKRIHNEMLDQAKDALDHDDLEEAAKLYKRLLPIDTTFSPVYYEMGLCMLHMPGQKEKAVGMFEHAARHGHVEATFELAKARHTQQRFDQALDLFASYKGMNMREMDDVEVDRRIAMVMKAKEMVKQPIELDIRNMGGMVNSDAHDYCPLVTADGNTMYFTSRRPGTTGGLKDPSGQWFEDIYSAKRIDEIWTNAVNAGQNLNTIVHDATVGLNPDGSSLIVYRTQKNLVSGDLYEAHMHSREWQTPELMTDKINSIAHEPSASIAPGGNEIYFTSDRPGGYGGRDIYRIRRLPNNEWSMPLNLGPMINTEFDEDAPFIHSDGTTLFFSSNGHSTMGGYDIFKSVLMDPDMNGWATPENMGYPLNTVNDDIYFCLSEDGYTGYFSSERPGGMGMQDIYQVIFPGSQLNYVVVRGVVADASDEPLKARIILTDMTGEEVLGVFNSNEKTGRYLMVLEPGHRYKMSVESTGFATYAGELHAKAVISDTREMPLDIQMISGGASAGISSND